MGRVIGLIHITVLLIGLQNSANANPLTQIKKIAEFAASLHGDYNKIVDLFTNPQSFQQKYGETDRAIVNLINIDVKELMFLKFDFMDIFKIDDEGPATKANLKFLFDNIDKIVNQFDKFRLIAEANKYSQSELNEFAENIYSNFNTLPALSTHLTADMMEKVYRYDDENSSMCERNETMQQIAVSYFKTLIDADLQILAMKIHALGIKNDALDAKKRHVDSFIKTTDEAFQVINKVLHRYSRELWKCDPHHYERDVTYSKLQEVFQTFVNFESDEDVLEKHYSKKCRSGCGIFNDTTEFYSVCKSEFCDSLPTKKRCTGHFRNCQDLSDGRINTVTTLCHSHPKSERRYEWLETGGKKYGRKHSCDTAEYKKDGRYNVRYDWGSSCLYCTCTCVINDEDVDRYFSLEPVTADVCKNRVVTGVRFEKHRHTFFTRIQQGELKAHGYVDPDTVEWKKLEDSSLRYSLYTNTSRGYKQSQSDEYSYINNTIFYDNPYVYSVDYDRRTFVFDEIEPRYENYDNAVITGLKLVQVRDYLRLQLQMTPFDYDTGKLLDDKAKWLPDLNDPIERTELKLNKASIPSEVKTEHKIDSSPSQFIKFQVTDLEADFGQTVVPFLDMQEVKSSIPAPLSGAGIVHKGADGSGGFLAFKLVQFDFAKNLAKLSSLAQA